MTNGLGRLVMGVLVVLLLLGCEKKSGLEGKIMDGKGQSLGKVRIVATPVQPIKLTFRTFQRFFLLWINAGMLLGTQVIPAKGCFGALGAGREKNMHRLN